MPAAKPIWRAHRSTASDANAPAPDGVSVIS